VIIKKKIKIVIFLKTDKIWFLFSDICNLNKHNKEFCLILNCFGSARDFSHLNISCLRLKKPLNKKMNSFSLSKANEDKRRDECNHKY
jgi:hypothetical protein